MTTRPRHLALLGAMIAMGPGVAPAVAADDGPSAIVTAAAPDGSFVLRRVTIDAGGTSGATGATHRLAATIGQPEPALATGAGYRLMAGFWAPLGGDLGEGVFADGFELP